MRNDRDNHVRPRLRLVQPGERQASPPPPPPRRGRVRKLRLLFVAIPLAVLAIISTIFGMMMAVASDLPSLDTRKEFLAAKNSILLDSQGRRIGVLTGQDNRILVEEGQVSPAMQRAIIAIEDERFYENDGIDVQAIGRAMWADITSGGAQQGGSTIAQQFVKNALEAQDNRTIMQKMREAALAFHLTRKWSKSKILNQYLNTIYFGNGAYGVESAARTYFKWNHPGCEDNPNDPCASQLLPHEAALLAGMVSSPAGYDPVTNPKDSLARRNLVLNKMVEQGYLTEDEAARAKREPLPTREQIDPPQEQSDAPYFTTWVKQQLVERYGPRETFGGGLVVKTSLDMDLQKAAEQAVNDTLAGAGPTASLVALDNATGEVRAMVGGTDYASKPFNLATQGQRQPGSAFKPFVLAAALNAGIPLSSTWESKPKIFDVPNSADKHEKFVVNNYQDAYAGVSDLLSATANSDNSVYAELGIKLGLKKVKRMARKMGITTPISTNQAMTLGGLESGVTPLDMAHAYETIAAGGDLVTGTLASQPRGPVGVVEVKGPDGDVIAKNEVERKRVFSEETAAQMQQALQAVIQSGTGTSANLGMVFAAGKTGTTENSGDAWFVGFTKRYTVAVWVGYPDSLKPMETEYHGQPVTGGSYPAEIWRAFMLAAIQIDESRGIKPDPNPPEGVEGTADVVQASSGVSGLTGPTGDTSSYGATGATGVTSDTGPTDSSGYSESGDTGTSSPQAVSPTPSPEPAPTPSPAPTPVAPPPPAAVDPGSGGGVIAPE